ncbi:hypothetical protein [Prochlorococcus sp. MIT 1307]|nr:hypothetical protein [Prochlorococcus sp. MIT 1307]
MNELHRNVKLGEVSVTVLLSVARLARGSKPRHDGKKEHICLHIHSSLFN